MSQDLRERERERESSEATDESQKPSLFTYVLSIIGSLALVYVAIYFAPMLEQNDIIATQHMDFNGFDISYVFWVRVVLITTAIMFVVRSSLNFFLDLKTKNPVLSERLCFVNLCFAAGMWIFLGLDMVYGIIKAIVEFENTFDWWLMIVLAVAFAVLYAKFSIYLKNNVLKQLPEFPSMCVCLGLSAGSMPIMFLGFAIVGIVAAIIIGIFVLKLVFGFLGLF